MNANEWIEYLWAHKNLSDWDVTCKRFYNSNVWREVRAQVLKLDHNECQLCKDRGLFTQAQTVHHVIHLRDNPDLALSIYYSNKRQLISLCNDCHNKVHPEKSKAFKEDKEEEPLTCERW